MTANTRTKYSRRFDSNNSKNSQVNKNNGKFLKCKGNDIFLKEHYDQQMFLLNEEFIFSENSEFSTLHKDGKKKSFFKKIKSFFTKKSGESLDDKKNYDLSTSPIRKCIEDGIIIPHLLNSHCPPSSYQSYDNLKRVCELETSANYEQGVFNNFLYKKSKNETEANGIPNERTCKKEDKEENSLTDKEEGTQTVLSTIDIGIQAEHTNSSSKFKNNYLLNTPSKFNQPKQNHTTVFPAKFSKMKSKKGNKTVNHKGIIEDNNPKVNIVRHKSQIKTSTIFQEVMTNSQKDITEEALQINKKRYSMKISQMRSGKLMAMKKPPLKSRYQPKELKRAEKCDSNSTPSSLTSTYDKPVNATEGKSFLSKRKEWVQKLHNRKFGNECPQNNKYIFDHNEFKIPQSVSLRKQELKRQPEVVMKPNQTMKDKKSCDQLIISECKNNSEDILLRNKKSKLMKSGTGSNLCTWKSYCNSPNTNLSRFQKITSKTSLSEFVAQPVCNSSEKNFDEARLNKTESLINQNNKERSSSSLVSQKFEPQQHTADNRRQPIVSQPNYISSNRPVTESYQILWSGNLLQNAMDTESSEKQYRKYKYLTDSLSENVEPCTSESTELPIIIAKSEKNTSSTEINDFPYKCEESLTSQNEKSSKIENDYNNHLRKFRRNSLEEFRESDKRRNILQKEASKNIEKKHEFHMLHNDAKFFQSTTMGTFNSYLNINVKQFEALMSNGCVTLCTNSVQGSGKFLRSIDNFHFEEQNTPSNSSDSVSPPMTSRNSPFCKEYSINNMIKINNRSNEYLTSEEANSLANLSEVKKKHKGTVNKKTRRTPIQKGIASKQYENNNLSKSRFNPIADINNFPSSKKSLKISKEACIMNKIKTAKNTEDETTEKTHPLNMEPVHGVFSGNLSLVSKT